jgi:serine protease inhibitor
MQQQDHVLGRAKGIGALLGLAAALGGCGGGGVGTAQAPSGSTPNGISGSAAPTAVIQAQKADAPVDPAIVAADNAFGLNLLNTLIPGAGGSNVAISPISVALALQIVYNGAAGTTQTAMAQTLQFGSLSTQALNSDNAALQGSLINPDPKVQLTIANSLWMHLASNPVSSSFVQTDETYYGATVGDLSGAPDNVNAWVAGETHDLITQILPPEPPGYYQQIIAIIANAIYFKGQWTTAFDVTQTSAAPFTLSDGTQTSAEMMHQTGFYPYLQETWHGTQFQALRIPYGAGRLSMLIVLPNSGANLSSFVAGMTVDALNSWTAQLQTTSGSIALPRFTSTYGASLPPALTSLGMGIAFCTSNEADFSALAPLACISDVEHKTVVEVDESGTVAAGATTVTIGVDAVTEPQFAMTMDHPFFYAIQDDETGELLFIGVLTNPN